jgi:hypothetical protein
MTKALKPEASVRFIATFVLNGRERLRTRFVILSKTTSRGLDTAAPVGAKNAPTGIEQRTEISAGSP